MSESRTIRRLNGTDSTVLAFLGSGMVSARVEAKSKGGPLALTFTRSINRLGLQDRVSVHARVGEVYLVRATDPGRESTQR